MTGPSVAQIVQTRRDALLRRWRANPLLQVQAAFVGALERLASLDLDKPGRAANLGRRSIEDAVIVAPPHGPDDRTGMARIADRFAPLGFRRADVVAGLQDMFNHATRRPQ